MARKILPLEYRANNQVTFAMTFGERNALTDEACRLGLTRAELLRGALFGDYSVKAALEGKASGKVVILHLNLTLQERQLVDAVSQERNIGISKLIRGIFYETA